MPLLLSAAFDRAKMFAFQFVWTYRPPSYGPHLRPKNLCRGTGDSGTRRSATELHRRSPPYPVAGIAPATSRLIGEVTRIFTTGKLSKTIPYRGTSEQSTFRTAVLAELQRLTAPAGLHTCVCGLDEVSLVFTTGKINLICLQPTAKLSLTNRQS